MIFFSCASLSSSVLQYIRGLAPSRYLIRLLERMNELL